MKAKFVKKEDGNEVVGEAILVPKKVKRNPRARYVMNRIKELIA